MSKETQRSSDRFDWDVAAADALEQARQMAPGPERNEALKLASSLRCTADERGLVLCSYPRGDRPRRPFPYCNEVWTGVEYSAAIGLLLDGDRAAAERIVTDVRDRYDGRRRNPFNEVECGHHYVRSMASWGLVEAWALTADRRHP